MIKEKWLLDDVTRARLEAEERETNLFLLKKALGPTIQSLAVEYEINQRDLVCAIHEYLGYMIEHQLGR